MKIRKPEIDFSEVPARWAAIPEFAQSEVRVFIRQEACHTALHDGFNSILGRSGYDVAHFERYFEAEFEKLLRTKSLARKAKEPRMFRSYMAAVEASLP